MLCLAMVLTSASIVAVVHYRITWAPIVEFDSKLFFYDFIKCYEGRGDLDDRLGSTAAFNCSESRYA